MKHEQGKIKSEDTSKLMTGHGQRIQIQNWTYKFKSDQNQEGDDEQSCETKRSRKKRKKNEKR